AVPPRTRPGTASCPPPGAGAHRRSSLAAARGDAAIPPRVRRATERPISLDHDQLIATEPGTVVLGHQPQLQPSLPQRRLRRLAHAGLDEAGSSFAMHAWRGDGLERGEPGVDNTGDDLDHAGHDRVRAW